jgi:flagellar biosynthesis/type III secretory pathway chaperone
MNMHNRQGPAPQKINVPDIAMLTARLAQLLAEEADLLAAMKIKKIEALQQEKLFLVNALESHRKIIDKHPHLLESIPSRDRSELEGIAEVFKDILKENHRRLMVAREVNKKVVETITQVVKESAASSVYGENGISGAMGTQTLSVTLNQTA